MLMLAIDANFKLKMKDRDAKNTFMGDGWAFFVSQEAYAEHINNNTNTEEVCGSTTMTCVCTDSFITVQALRVRA